jgi:sortase B
MGGYIFMDLKKFKFSFNNSVIMIIIIAMIAVIAVTLVTIAISLSNKNTVNNSVAKVITSQDIFGKIIAPDSSTLNAINSAEVKNSDVKGLITISGTKINNVVLQSADNNFYVNKNEEKQISSLGSYFFDSANNIGTRYQLDKNTIIYGNNIDDNKNGQGFAQLLNYTDKKFAEKNSYIYLTTKTDKMVFNVFAAFYTDTNFDYLQTATSNKVFMEMAIKAYKRSNLIFDTDISIDDKIITLSTAAHKYGNRKDQRFVVMARLLHNNEKMNKSNLISINGHPQLPQFASSVS